MEESEQQQIFESWINQHKGLLFKVVRAYAITSSDQDDLFQEISLQIWGSIPRFRQESAVTTWLYRISLNTALKWSSKEHKREHGRQPMENIDHILQEQVKAVDERLEWLCQEISNFREIDRSLTLLLLDGYSYKEMSNMLGLSESNIGVKINRIKKHLITQSKKYDYHGV